MTQPPPNEPPKGFGPPQDVPASAPLPPAQPPGAPGYGYPQQPPQGYGYPQQPPTGPQPPYGAQFPNAPQPAPRPKLLNRTQLLIVVSAVVAIALIIGSGIWYSSSKGDDTAARSGRSEDAKGKKDAEGGAKKGDAPAAAEQSVVALPKEKKPASTDGKALFKVPQPEVKDLSRVYGSWATDNTYAKSTPKGIDGYDPATGKVKWTYALPGEVCGGSKYVTTENQTAVVYKASRPAKKGEHAPCSELAVFDLDTGAPVWKKSMKYESRALDPMYGEVAISGGAVAVGGTSVGGLAYSLADGSELWKPNPTQDCLDLGYGGGPALVAVRRCGGYDKPKFQIQPLDPRTGKPKFSFELPEGVKSAKIISTDPLTVGVDSTGESLSGVTDVFAVDDQGELRSKVSLEDGKFNLSCDVGKYDGCKFMAVGNDKLYVATEPHEGGTGSYSEVNELVAFDLATGKSTGERADSGDDYEFIPLRMDGDDILAYKRGPYDKGGQVVVVDAKTFKETVHLQNPSDEATMDAERGFSPKYAEMLYRAGRLYLSESLLSKPLSDGDVEYLAIGFGAK
ncbi:PQQ-binding-like beta-propeller repeat protein [Streptomyces sp. NPDC060194]|uniref:outer membrane protein assembly factor BamB family protein n=1 Tax=Streptomyces sp. NPDC060194 TaxID=3347069 RepID=UPI00365A5165